MQTKRGASRFSRKRWPRGSVLAAAVFVGVALAGCGGGSAPTTGDESIYLAAYNGDSAKVSAYLHGGFDVNRPDENGRTLLHHAAAGNRLNVMEILTEEFQARVNVADHDGRTPLDLAREANAQDAIRYLEEAG